MSQWVQDAAALTLYIILYYNVIGSIRHDIGLGERIIIRSEDLWIPIIIVGIIIRYSQYLWIPIVIVGIIIRYSQSIWIFKNLLLNNHWANFHQIWYTWTCLV